MPLADLLDVLGGFSAHATATNTTAVTTALSVNPTIANIFGGGGVSPSIGGNVSPSTGASTYIPPGSLGTVDMGSNIPGLNLAGNPQGPSLGNALTAQVGGIPVWVIALGGVAALLLVGGIAKSL